MQLKEFVDFLVYKSGMNITELAKELNISRQTLSNWRNERIEKIDTETITKLGEAMRRNHWGIRLGSVSRSTIEIINTTDQATSDISKLNKPDSELREDVIKYQIKHMEMLELERDNLKAENQLLKEKLEKYKSK
jgi:transcriptional regulator with XRE-family HTH domain